MSRYGRGSAHQRGYDSRWRKARITYLMQNPLCRMCEDSKRLTPATVVDHIIPHKLWNARQSGNAEAIAKAQALFWDQSNWQPLCKPCHDGDKQQLERTGRLRGCGVDGWPIGS